MNEHMSSATVEFAKTLGIRNFKFPESGIVQFAFDNNQTFFIEAQEHGALCYLRYDMHHDHSSEQMLYRILCACHYKESYVFDVQCALHEVSHMVLLTWIRYEQMNASKIDEILLHLSNIISRACDH